MKDDKLNVVKAWFKKAENDLINAENTIKMESPPTDTICFHAQQCAEKPFVLINCLQYIKTSTGKI